jgi:tripartite-type tricarboxylate transporter receptor subunit TctC
MTRTFLGIALAVLFAVTGAQAQSYPSRPVTIVVPYPAGGPTDLVARQLAPKLSARFGQNFIVENVSGGGTNIAGQRVARAAPDGHTLYIPNLQFSANVALYKSLPFDTEKDFAPIGMINNNPLVLTARKSLPANTQAEWAAWMKTTKARMAHPGTGSTGHLATFMVAQALGVEVTHIPYRGAAPALQDILGGHVDLFFATPQQVVGNLNAGEIKAFGITSRTSSPLMPQVPSFVQTYGPNLEILFWHIMLAPAGTPAPIINALNAALQEAVSDPDILAAWAKTGVSAYAKEQQTPAGAAVYLKKEIAHWGQVVRDNKIEAPAN